jgi:hypothetical protein
MTMNDVEKLRVLIPHWLEHNEEHAEEFRRWATGAGNAAGDILSAADSMSQVNQFLQIALEKLGGPLEYDHHSHGEAGE